MFHFPSIFQTSLLMCFHARRTWLHLSRDFPLPLHDPINHVIGRDRLELKREWIPQAHACILHPRTRTCARPPFSSSLQARCFWWAHIALASPTLQVPCKRRNCMLSVGKSRVVIPLRRLFQQTASLIATPSTLPASLSQPLSYDTTYLRVSRRCYHEASSSLRATSPDRRVCPPNHAHCLGGPRILNKFHSCRAGWHTPTMHRWWAPAVLQEHSMVCVALGIISITSATIITWGSAPI
jgi:hypothetical protein